MIIVLCESVSRLYSALDIDVLAHPKTKTIHKLLIKKYILFPRDLIHIASAIERNFELLTLDDNFKQRY